MPFVPGRTAAVTIGPDARVDIISILLLLYNAHKYALGHRLEETEIRGRKDRFADTLWIFIFYFAIPPTVSELNRNSKLPREFNHYVKFVFVL